MRRLIARDVSAILICLLAAGCQGMAGGGGRGGAGGSSAGNGGTGIGGGGGTGVGGGGGSGIGGTGVGGVGGTAGSGIGGTGVGGVGGSAGTGIVGGTSPKEPFFDSSHPYVQVMTPMPFATYFAPATIRIWAHAPDYGNDSVNGYAPRVDFYLGTMMVGSATVTPSGRYDYYQVDVTNVPAGSYDISVKSLL